MKKVNTLLIIFLIFFTSQFLFPDNATYYISRMKTLMYQKKFKVVHQELLSLKKIPIQLNEKRKILLYWEKEIFSFLENGDTKKAIEFLNTLKEVFPREWRLYNISSKIFLKDFSFSLMLKSSFLSLYYFYLENKFLFLSTLIKSLIISLWSTFAFFTFFYVIKFSALFLADIGLLEEGEDKSIAIKIIVFFVFVLLPVFLLSGIYFFPFVLMALIYPYLKIGMRKIANTIVLLFIVLFPLSILLNEIQHSESDKTNLMIKKIESGYYLKDDFKKAIDIWNKVKEPYVGSVLLKRYYLDGYVLEARQIAEALPSTGDFFKFKNFMLGNIYYKLGFFNKAENCYRKVISEEPESAPANYNMAVLLNRLNELDKAETFIKASREFAKEKNLNFDKLYPVAYYPEKLKIRLFNNLNIIELILNPFLLSVLIYLIVKSLIQIFGTIGRSGRCTICGKVVKGKSITEKVEYCNECFNLFVIKDPMLSETRKIRYEEIESQKQKMFFLYSFLSLIIPGFALLELEKRKLFVGLSFFFMLLVSFFSMSIKISQISPTNSFPESIAIILIILIFYILIGIITFINGREEWL